MNDHFQVTILRLANNEEFIGSAMLTTEEWEIKNPAVLVPNPQQQGQIVLVPAAPFCEDPANINIKIAKSNVVFSYRPSKALTDHYHQMYSKIVPATGSGLDIRI